MIRISTKPYICYEVVMIQGLNLRGNFVHTLTNPDLGRGGGKVCTQFDRGDRVTYVERKSFICHVIAQRLDNTHVTRYF